jgi:hypothetical protein
MSVITAAQIRAAAKSRVNEANMNSVLVAIDKFALGLGLNRPPPDRTLPRAADARKRRLPL